MHIVTINIITTYVTHTSRTMEYKTTKQQMKCMLFGMNYFYLRTLLHSFTGGGNWSILRKPPTCHKLE